MSSLVSYVFSNVVIKDPFQLRNFLVTVIGSQGVPIYSTTYDKTTNTFTVNTSESAFSSSTQSLLDDAIRNQYPDPPLQPTSSYATDVGDSFISQSVYGYFLSTTAIDDDAVISKNTSLTRNMYYRRLTVNAGVTLNANGWRILVSDTLTLNGTISNDGTDAVGTSAGVGVAPIYSSYLSAGTGGGQGLTANGNGNNGVSAQYQSAGGMGGAGGSAGTYIGGSPGVIIPISPVDGGIQSLATMPIAFLGRLISNNFYISAGSGGGSGACNKGTALTVKGGAGAGAGGFMIVAARNILGTGLFSAKGGNGSSSSWTGSGTQVSGGIGGGGGGGGGCIIVITQGKLPSSITFNVKGGTGGLGTPPGTNGQNGQDGNVFMVNV